MVKIIHKNLEIISDEVSYVELCKDSIVTKARNLCDLYRAKIQTSEIMDEKLGLDSSNNNDFDQYIN